MDKKLKLSIVGLGANRGYHMLQVFSNFKNVEVVGLCDLREERINCAQDYLKEKGFNKPKAFLNYVDLFNNVEMDAVYIVTSWDYHIDIAVDAMNKGIIVAMEVGGAYSEDDCWRLVHTYEKTKTPFMFMENCCFDKAEMLAFAMVQDNLFGKIAHCSGTYTHDLREEVFTGLEKRHYRIHDYMLRNCENYPTHELGPIAKMLNINAGNRMVSLISMSNEPIGMEEYTYKKLGETYGKPKYKQSDVVNTLIKCAGGETISLKLMTTLPHYYDRNLVIEGTNGVFSQSLYSVYLDDGAYEERYNSFDNVKDIFGNAQKYEDKYLPKCWKGITKEQIDAGHGGMDYIMSKYFIECALTGKGFYCDVYDAASWMSISYLSEQSLLCGGAPQSIPDFTRGKWMKRNKMKLPFCDE